MDYSDFYDVAVYGNSMWKGGYTQKEISCNAYNYLCEFNVSNKKGNPTNFMQELCKLLIGDETEEAKDFLMEIMLTSNWKTEVYHCSNCGKEEIAFFSKNELKNLSKNKMLIQDAIPNKPSWIREAFVSGICLCLECWQKLDM